MRKSNIIYPKINNFIQNNNNLKNKIITDVSRLYNNLNLKSESELQSLMINNLDFKKLRMFGIHYFSLGFKLHTTDKSKTIGLDNTWFDFILKDDFLSQNYIKKDKIWNEMFKTCLKYNDKNPYQQKILLHSAFDYSSSFDREIMSRMRKYKIKKGFKIITNHEKYITVLSFASDNNYFSELDFIIKNGIIISEIQRQASFFIENELINVKLIC